MSIVIEKWLSGEGKGSFVVRVIFELCEIEFCFLKVIYWFFFLLICMFNKFLLSEYYMLGFKLCVRKKNGGYIFVFKMLLFSGEYRRNRWL